MYLMRGRIDYLDGLRGIAILLVIFFHAYARWVDLVPYGGDYKNIFIFKYGWLGVNLFFLISGYVIFMTLDKCSGFKDFIVRRWLRLFPAMLFASLLIYLTAPWFVDRPAGQPLLRSLLPGITFIDPFWWEKLTKISFPPMEDAFWSLYVEFEFYIFSGIVFFLFGRLKFLVLIFICFLLNRFFHFYVDAFVDMPIIYNIGKAVLLMSFEYYGWFASGAAFYLYALTKAPGWYWSAVFMGCISAGFLRYGQAPVTVAALSIVVLFAVSQRYLLVQKFFSSKIFCFFGFISYPLYLMHENFMISSVVLLGKLGFYPLFILPFLPISVLIFISYLVARFYEPIARSILRRYIFT
jgi:peptidoglycan/LPS O-acetylase OafA/YrhL